MRTHSLLWIVITLLIFLLGPLIVSPASCVATIDREIDDARRWYSESEVQRIAARGEDIYQLFMVSTGIDPALRKHMIKGPVSQEIAPNTQMPAHIASWLNGFLDYWLGLLCNIHLFCFRIAHSLTWFVYLVPFLAAIVFDGVMTRQAKIVSFKYTSPTIYNASWHIMIALVCFSIMVFALAYPLPVFYHPIVITCFGIMSRALIGNVQHSA